MRGPVTPKEKAPATVTWKNDEAGKPDPKIEDLAPRMQKVAVQLPVKVEELESVNLNSGKRAGDGPHSEGRGLDINMINGIRVRDLGSASGQEADKARRAATNLETWAKENPDVNQFIGPKGGWEIKNGRFQEILPSDSRVSGHKHHYHINVIRK